MWNTVMLAQGQPPKPQDSHVLVKHVTRIDYQLVVVRSVHRESLTCFTKTCYANRLPVGSRKLLRLSITSW
jgi:hypothetical protein